MIPVANIIAAIGISLSIILLRYKRTSRLLLINNYYWFIFIIYILIISLFNLFFNIRLLFFRDTINGDMLIGVENVINKILFIWTIFLLLIFIIKLPKVNQIKSCLLIALFGGLSHYYIRLILNKLPVVVWRYIGAIDFIMIFGWLMISERLLHIEYNNEFIQN